MIKNLLATIKTIFFLIKSTYSSLCLNFPRIWFGNRTTPGHGNWPGTMHMQARSHPTPKFDGFSRFCSSFCSANTCSLQRNVFFLNKLSLQIWNFFSCVDTIQKNYLDFPIVRRQWARISSFFLLSMSMSSSFPFSVNKIAKFQFAWFKYESQHKINHLNNLP